MAFESDLEARLANLWDMSPAVFARLSDAQRARLRALIAQYDEHADAAEQAFAEVARYVAELQST